MADKTLRTLTTGGSLAPGDLFLTRLASDTEDKALPASAIATFIGTQGFLTSTETESYTTTAEVSTLVCGMLSAYPTSNFVSATYLTKVSSSAFLKLSEVCALDYLTRASSSAFIKEAEVCVLLSAYATSNYVSSTYLTKVSSSAFLKLSEVCALDYLTRASSSAFIKEAEVCVLLSAYATSNYVSSTYLTKVSSSAFLKQADVCTLLTPYLTSASAEARFLVSALTTAQVSSYGYLTSTLVCGMLEEYITSQETSALIESLMGPGGGLTSADVCGMLSAYLTSQAASSLFTVGKNGAIGFTVDGGTVSVCTSHSNILFVPFNCVISSWNLISETTCDLVIDIRKATYTAYPSVSTITGTDVPTLTDSLKNQSSTLTGWNTSVGAGDVLQFVVVSALSAIRATLVLKVTKV